MLLQAQFNDADKNYANMFKIIIYAFLLLLWLNMVTERAPSGVCGPACLYG